MKTPILTAALIATSVAFAVPATAETLTQKDIDQFLAQTPAVLQVLQTATQDLSAEELKVFTMAQMDMDPYTTLAQIMDGKPGQARLDEVASQGGYESFQAYADTADRIYSVAFTGVWVGQTSGMMEAGAEQVSNPFEYIQDESRPQEARERLRADLHKFCHERCTNPDDMEIVSANYEAVTRALHLRE